MKERRIVFLGIWSIIAIIGMVLLVMLVLNRVSPTGAFTKSGGYLQFEPNELCGYIGCEMVQVTNLPPKMNPSVDCNCNGEIRSLSLFQPNLEEFPKYL